jgi:hypothetical protein
VIKEEGEWLGISVEFLESSNGILFGRFNV